MYRYSIGGVSYECAGPDILKGAALIDATCLGSPASVRYDPKNPANSIIIAEGWAACSTPIVYWFRRLPRSQRRYPRYLQR